MALVRAVLLRYRTARIRFVIGTCLEYINLIPFTDEDKFGFVRLNARVQSRNNDTVNVVHN
jgi:hypothetical protein